MPGREREHPAGGVTRGTDSPGRVTSLASVVTAIVLVSTAVDRVPEVAQAIAGLDGVSEVYSVAGEVDLVAMVRVRQHEQLAEVIADKLHKVDGVRDTRTLIAFQAYSRHDLEAAFSLGDQG